VVDADHPIGAVCRRVGASIMAVLRMSTDWRRRLTPILAVACLAAGSARGQVAPAQPAAERPVDRPAFMRKLQAPIRFDFDAVPLREFVAKLAEASGLGIRLDEEAVRKAGISLDLHITAKLHEQPLHSALAEALPKYGLNYAIDGQGLRVLPMRPLAAPAARAVAPPAVLVAPAPRVLAPQRRLDLVEELSDADLKLLEKQIDAIVPVLEQAQPAQLVGRQIGIRNGFMLEVVSAPAAAAERARHDDLVDETAPAPVGRIQVRVTSATFENWLMGGKGKFDDLRPRLEKGLEAKIAAVDRVCKLSEMQKQKLVLAGRGDIHGAVTRADELRQEFERTLHDPKKSIAVFEASRPLRQLLNSGMFAENSLFDKILKSILTADQAAAYDRLVTTPAGQAAPMNIKPGSVEVKPGF